MARFPIGGERKAVYDYLKSYGFVMGPWSDKHWERADGLRLHVYGAGSKARIYRKDGTLIVEDALDAAVQAVCGGATKLTGESGAPHPV
jgi:hypothetical protein